MSRGRGNPNFIRFRRQRIDELKKLLKSTPLEDHQRVLAQFALNHSLRIEKVREYYRLLVLVGEVDGKR